MGAGTRIRFGMKVMGRTYSLRAAISEPEPGRVLVETDLDGLIVTTFTADPVDAGRTRMTIATRGYTRTGFIAALFERWLIERLLRRIYVEELALLAEAAAAG